MQATLDPENSVVTTQHVDMRVLHDMIGDDQESMSMLLEIAAGDIPNQCVDLARFLTAGDAKSAGTAAHTMIGTLAALGANTSVEMLRRIEDCCEVVDLEGAKQMLIKVHGEIQNVLREVEALRKCTRAS